VRRRAARRPSGWLSPVLALVVAALLPATVHASTISYAGSTMTIDDAPSSSALISVLDTDSCWSHDPCVSVSDYHSTINFPADHCSNEIGFLECDRPDTVVVNLGEGDDSFSGYDGHSEIHGGSGADSLRGGGDNDDIFGESGNDYLTGHQGDDRLDGGEGNDTFENSYGGGSGLMTAGSDVYVGGPGNDEVDYGPRTDALTITIDAASNDGGLGEGDNVGMDVEEVDGGTGADTLTGSDGPNTFSGNGGNDTLIGAGGEDSLYGGSGDDRLAGNDGQDNLRGDAGNDDLDGGAGLDDFIADSLVDYDDGGMDHVNARDGLAEHVYCGIGEDTAILDATDVVVDTLRDQCEHIDRSAAVSPPPPPGPAGAAGDHSAPGLSGLKAGTLHLGRTTTVRYTLTERATVTFRVGRRTRRKGKVRYVAVSGTFRHTGPKGPNSVRFNGRLAGKRLKPGRYRLTAVARDDAGNASTPKSAELRVKK